MKDHFIVCGFGRVGRNAAFELQRTGAPFLVIDRSEARVAQATEAGMLAIQADATRDESLREAGAERARGFIAALATDADNVFVILSAKTLNPRLTVVTRASEEDAEEKLKRAGADTVFSPFSMAGTVWSWPDPAPRSAVTRFLDQNAGPRCDHGGASCHGGIAARCTKSERYCQRQRRRHRVGDSKSRRQDAVQSSAGHGLTKMIF